MKDSSFLSRSRGARLAASVALAAATVAPSVMGATQTLSLTPDVLVPDGNASGLVSVLNAPLDGFRVLDVNLAITLEGVAGSGWNGDLYVLLSHGGNASVLVNRPGVTASNPFGYADNGLFSVTFDDEAIGGDFHLYQDDPAWSSLIGDPVEGSWQPDARATDPAAVLDTDPRTHFLSVFDGDDAGGPWRLFVADLSSGGQVRLARWELTLELEPLAIPETSTALAGVALGAAVLLTRRLRAR
jgi:hypothetical protein